MINYLDKNGLALIVLKLKQYINGRLKPLAPRTWSDIQTIVRSGKVLEYLNVGDQLEAERLLSIAASVRGEGISDATVDEDVFFEHLGEIKGGKYTFVGVGDVWTDDNGDTINLDDYGVSYTGSPVGLNVIEVIVTTEKIAFDIIGFDQDVPTTSNTKIKTGSGITAVDVDYFTFLKKMGNAGEFKFIYDGTDWKLREETVNLSQYGVEVTGTPARGDVFTVDMPHSMTLCMHEGNNDTVVYDMPEAVFYVDGSAFPDGLAPGTYHFTWDFAAGENIVVGDYQFSLTKAVPVGGQICIGTNSNRKAIADCRIATYAIVGSTTPIESEVNITAGSSGISLGTISADTTTATVNSGQRILYGSGNWENSCVRQWLNSVASDYWEAKTRYDRPYKTQMNGFLEGVAPNFVSVVGTVYKKTQLSITDGYGLANSIERFFLLSRAEVYGGAERFADGADGEPYEYFSKYSDLDAPSTLADSNRIKYNNTDLINWFVRTVGSNSGCYIRCIINNGSFSTTNAAGSQRIAVGCVIY